MFPGAAVFVSVLFDVLDEDRISCFNVVVSNTGFAVGISKHALSIFLIGGYYSVFMVSMWGWHDGWYFVSDMTIEH